MSFHWTSFWTFFFLETQYFIYVLWYISTLFIQIRCLLYSYTFSAVIYFFIWANIQYSLVFLGLVAVVYPSIW